MDFKADLKRYITGSDKLEFTYAEVSQDANYSQEKSNSHMKEKLNKYVEEKQLDQDSFDHEKCKMNGRAALLIIMKRTGSEGAENNKRLLDLIISTETLKKKAIKALKQKVITEIEKQFDDFHID